MSQHNSAARQAAFICLMVNGGHVSRENVCAKTLVEIPELAEHFRIIRERDGAWYAQHRWQYYPTVKCGSDGSIHLSVMGLDFRCDGSGARSARSLLSADAWAQPLAPEQFSGDSQQEPSVASSDFPRFSQQITLNPIAGMPSLISLVVDDPKQVKQARALFVLDNELLVVPLRFHESANAFRGVFPTPVDTLSYRFQLINAAGKADLSEPQNFAPRCEGGSFRPDSEMSDEVRELIALQAKEQRLSFALDTIEKMAAKNP